MDLHLVSFGLCDVDYYSDVAVSKSLRQAMREKNGNISYLLTKLKSRL